MPITSRTTLSPSDTPGLDALIGAKYDYRVAVSNREEEAFSNTLTLSSGDVLPGLRFTADPSRPFPDPNSAEFYAYDRSSDTLRVYSTVTHTLARLGTLTSPGNEW